MSDAKKSGMTGSSGARSERVTVRLSDDLLVEIESLVEDGKYQSVSDVLRDGAIAIVDGETVSLDTDR